VYREPSVSWASIDADKVRGIVHGEVTDRDILIEVKGVQINPTSKHNPFGMVAGKGQTMGEA
jgi:hypothetical protein